ncbi:unnamed protein product [Dimorphilus gyrociliatus]|uniref:Uncharacterized protein n=1 Tax=Dimorphilus gyrociliatus TaxID=2664684 RepID=A0A7I8V9G0_9ANNE|nr:unnamed protein product [Dimorphilus gyrociliatus]
MLLTDRRSSNSDYGSWFHETSPRTFRRLGAVSLTANAVSTANPLTSDPVGENWTNEKHRNKFETFFNKVSIGGRATTPSLEKLNKFSALKLQKIERQPTPPPPSSTPDQESSANSVVSSLPPTKAGDLLQRMQKMVYDVPLQPRYNSFVRSCTMPVDDTPDRPWINKKTEEHTQTPKIPAMTFTKPTVNNLTLIPSANETSSETSSLCGGKSILKNARRDARQIRALHKLAEYGQANILPPLPQSSPWQRSKKRKKVTFNL